MTPRNQLKRLFTQHWAYMAVYTACKLSLFDHLQKPLTAQTLAKQLNYSEKNLNLLLSALNNQGLLKQVDTKYQVNEISLLLTEQHPQTLKFACLNWGGEHLTAWQSLDYSIKTGKASFEHLYQEKFFDYLAKKPQKTIAYHKAMHAYAQEDYALICKAIDFSPYNSIMDVGGSYGALIQNIQQQHPQKTCYLFDQETVVQQALTSQEIQRIGGSFFKALPIQVDALILSRIIHDWPDDSAQIILKNCFNALNENGHLFIIENCKDLIDIDLSLLSLNMATLCNSFERSSVEYIALAKEQGFEPIRQVPLNQLQTILIFEKCTGNI